MKMPMAVIAVLLAFCPMPWAKADQFIDCNSISGDTQRCPADTRGGVWLVSQYSRSGCYENDTWGYDRGGIWVTNGCRAQFRVGDRYSRSDDRKAATAAAAILLGAAVVAAAHDKHERDRRDRDGDWYNDEYDRGCNAARHRSGWSDHESEGWRNGFRDCR